MADKTSLQWGTGDFAVFTVLRFTQVLNYQFAIIYEKVEDNDPFNGPQLYVTLQPNSRFSMGINNLTRMPSTDAGYEDNKVHMAMLRRTGNSLDMRVDGAATGSPIADAGVVDVSASRSAALIGANRTGEIQLLVGDIATVIGIPHTVSDADVAQVEAYLKERYGL